MPAVVSFYECHQKGDNADAVEGWINWLLARPGEAFPTMHGISQVPWSEYRDFLARRYYELWCELGTNLVHIHQGQIFSMERLIARMQSDVRKGWEVDVFDRHAFEANTGWNCTNWFSRHGAMIFLQVAAGLDEFLDQDSPIPKDGQRAFMGQMLGDVREAATVLGMYSPSSKIGTPEIRTILDTDKVFELEYGCDWLADGYHYRTLVPAEIKTGSTAFPWLTFHICVRDARIGSGTYLPELAKFVRPQPDDEVFQSSAIELLADTADETILASWRQLARESSDPDFTYYLCEGLLRRGWLSDILIVLEMYRRHHQHSYYVLLQPLLNQLLPFCPVTNDLTEEHSALSLCMSLEKKCDVLRQKVGRDNFRVFRGGLASTVNVAREIIELKHGPEITMDLRYRFEAATGINCSHWETTPNNLHHATAAKTAAIFLDSVDAAKHTTECLFFFGHPVKLRT